MIRRSGMLAIAVLTAALVGCAAEVSTPTVPRRIDPTRANPKELREHVSLNGVLAGAEAGRQMLVVRQVQQADPPPVAVVPPVPPIGPRVQIVSIERKSESPRPVPIKFTVRSEKPAPTETVALADALAVARVEVMKRLQLMEPPVSASPSLVAVRTEYLKEKRPVAPSEADKEEWRKHKLNPNQTYMEVDIEVSEGQLQRLRATERVDGSLRVAGLLWVVLLAAYGFFRLDAWSKGYLTGWLGLAAAVLVGVAALFMLA